MNKEVNENMEVNLQRLRRHYEINVKGYDKAALWDMSAVLRNWADMKLDVDSYIKSRNKIGQFHSYRIPDKVKKFIHQKQHIIVHLPKDGIYTSSPRDEHGNKEIITIPPILNIDATKMHLGFEVKLGEGDEIHFNKIIFLFNYTVPPDLISTFNKAHIKSNNFEGWMDSECLRLTLDINEKLESAVISREKLIRRCANSLGGSHPKGHKPQPDPIDHIIEFLLDIRIAQLPIIYIILLKISKDILELE